MKTRRTGSLINIDGCPECIAEAAKVGGPVDWWCWCWMLGCCLACDCYGREEAK